MVWPPMTSHSCWSVSALHSTVAETADNTCKSYIIDSRVEGLKDSTLLSTLLSMLTCRAHIIIHVPILYLLFASLGGGAGHVLAVPLSKVRLVRVTG